MVVILVTTAHIKSHNVGVCVLANVKGQPQRERPRLAVSSPLLSPKPVPLFSFPGEPLPLALALFAFVGFLLILVAVLLSIWKMGRLLRHSCCPVVVLPDTLVMLLSPPFSMTLIRWRLGLSWAWAHISGFTSICTKREEEHLHYFTSNQNGWERPPFFRA